jgi:hypothetical protein
MEAAYTQNKREGRSTGFRESWLYYFHCASNIKSMSFKSVVNTTFFEEEKKNTGIHSLAKKKKR